MVSIPLDDWARTFEVIDVSLVLTKLAGRVVATSCLFCSPLLLTVPVDGAGVMADSSPVAILDKVVLSAFFCAREQCLL